MKIIYRLFNFLKRNIKTYYYYYKYSTQSSYSNEIDTLKHNKINFNFSKPPSKVINLYLDHFFDILGSGWTNLNIKKSDNIETKINKTNQEYSNYVAEFISKVYSNIDWHLDFKSGFKWPENILSKFIKIKYIKGVDIKVPWELSRMYHLVHIATQYSNDIISLHKKRNKHEFINQVLDFISNNPPGFGVNWVSTMEVSIRISNILLAYDIFINSNCKFSKDFIKILSNSVNDHANFIINNLEWNHDNSRNNHYFSNIIGLLFCSTHLKLSSKSEAWFMFSYSERINEYNYQFNEDGTIFEGSTTYHLLVLEFVLWGVFIVLCNKNLLSKKNNIELKNIYKKNNRFINNVDRINKLIFPKWFFVKLYNSFNFLQDIKLYNDKIPQIGDNDSGRLFKISTIYKRYNIEYVKNKFKNLKFYSENIGPIYYYEDYLNISKFYDIYKRILINEFKLINKNFFNLNYNLNEFFIKSKKKNNYKNKFSEEYIELYIDKLGKNNSLYFHKESYNLPNNNFIDNLELFYYDDFGIYIYKSDNNYLLIRAYTKNQPPNLTGHFHQDQLSIELHINGKPIIVDPGSYLYTPDLVKRNLFRSIYYHSVPFHISDFDLSPSFNNIFLNNKIYKCEIYHFSNFGFYGSMKVKDKLIERIIILNKKSIEIYNISSYKYLNKKKNNIEYSPAYGFLEKLDYE